MSLSYEEISQKLASAFIESGVNVDESNRFYDLEIGPTITDVVNYFMDHHKDRMLSIIPECIEDDDAYGNLLGSFLNLTKGEVEADELNSTFSQNEEVLTFKVEETPYKWTIQRESDWMDRGFIKRVFELVDNHSKSRLLIDKYDDLITVVCVPDLVAKIMLEHYEGTAG